jgi:hypothetical protein
MLINMLEILSGEDRWPEAEPFINKDQKYAKAYARYIK